MTNESLTAALERRLQERRAELSRAELAKDSYAFTLKALVAELEALQAEGQGVADPPPATEVGQGRAIAWERTTVRGFRSGGRRFRVTELSVRLGPDVPRQVGEKTLMDAVPPFPGGLVLQVDERHLPQPDREHPEPDRGGRGIAPAARRPVVPRAGSWLTFQSHFLLAGQAGEGLGRGGPSAAGASGCWPRGRETLRPDSMTGAEGQSSVNGPWR